jgi:hypothetical protein
MPSRLARPSMGKESSSWALCLFSLTHAGVLSRGPSILFTQMFNSSMLRHFENPPVLEGRWKLNRPAFHCFLPREAILSALLNRRGRLDVCAQSPPAVVRTIIGRIRKRAQSETRHHAAGSLEPMSLLRPDRIQGPLGSAYPPQPGSGTPQTLFVHSLPCCRPHGSVSHR